MFGNVRKSAEAAGNNRVEAFGVTGVESGRPEWLGTEEVRTRRQELYTAVALTGGKWSTRAEWANRRPAGARLMFERWPSDHDDLFVIMNTAWNRLYLMSIKMLLY
jgi:hypothetical protein